MVARLFSVRRLHRSGASQQVTIPHDICEVMSFHPGDRVYVYLVGAVVCMKRMDEGGFAVGVVAIGAPPGGEINTEE